MHKTILLLALPMLQMVAGVSSCQPNNQPGLTASITGDTVANHTVVELFTSEGCSSCPAADKVLAGIAKAYAQKVIVLGFHVDYWNRLGWKDRFSDAAYSERQRQYASAVPPGEVYTPQAIVNGEEVMVGSDQKKLLNAIAKNTQGIIPARIHINAFQQNNNNQVTVAYSFDAAPGRVLNIALLQPDAETDVVAGENSGRKLHHVNIVRSFVVVSMPSGKIQMQLPEKIPAKELRIVGYAQDKKTMKISGATDYINVINL